MGWSFIKMSSLWWIKDSGYVFHFSSMIVGIGGTWFMYYNQKVVPLGLK